MARVRTNGATTWSGDCSRIQLMAMWLADVGLLRHKK